MLREQIYCVEILCVNDKVSKQEREVMCTIIDFDIRDVLTILTGAISDILSRTTCSKLKLRKKLVEIEIEDS